MLFSHQLSQNLKIDRRHLLNPEANWISITMGTETLYISPRYSTPYQPSSYIHNNQYYICGSMIAPSHILPTPNLRPILPLPHTQSIIIKSVKESSGRESPSLTPEQ